MSADVPICWKHYTDHTGWESCPCRCHDKLSDDLDQIEVCS